MKRKKFKPHKYQSHLIQHASRNPRCAFWAGLGVGKTVTVLTFLDNLWTVGDHHKTLVLAPKRVAKSVWGPESEKWDHLENIKVSAIVGTIDERRAALRADANVFTTNYENAEWLVREVGRKKWPFRNVIADESTRLKSFRLRQGGSRARYIGSIAHAGRVDRWINLTATPAPNGLQDLWGQMFFLDAGERLGRSYTAYMNRYFRRNWNGYGHELMPYSDQLINDKLGDICLSVDHELNTHKPIESNILVDLPRKAMRIYRDMEKNSFAEIGEYDVEVLNAANKSMKCLQIASGAAYVDKEKNWEWIHDAKIEALQSVVEEFSGMPILVAYHWKPSLKRLLEAFPKGRYFDDDKKTEADWNAGKIPLLFAHPGSAGHGLNLQDGSNVICFFDNWWSLEQREQIIGRIGPVRQIQSGYDRPVYIINIIARDTFDAVVLSRHKSKASVQDCLIHAARQRTRGQRIGPREIVR